MKGGRGKTQRKGTRVSEETRETRVVTGRTRCYTRRVVEGLVGARVAF